VISRFYILFVAEIRSSTIATVDIPFALAFRHAARAGTSFYADVEDLKRREYETHQPAGPPKQEAEFRVEYPPLAIEWIRFPLGLQPAPRPDSTLDDALHQAIFISRVITACVDLCGFLLLAWLLPGLFGGEGAWRQSAPLLLYAGGGVILFHILYDRPDLLVGVLLLAAIGLLCQRRHYLFSFAVLAVAINYKLAPVMLAPVWILGAVPAAALSGDLSGRRLARLGVSAAVRGAVLALLIAAIFLPFYFSWGNRTLDFLEYHAKRGLEIESSWAAAVFVANLLTGSPRRVAYTFGAIHVDSPAAHTLALISPWVTLLLLALATLSLWRALRTRLAHVQPGALTLAQAAPDLMAGYTVVFLLLIFASAKVLSPQYFLWLLPLMPLLSSAGNLNRTLLIGYLLLLSVTTAIFPYLFTTQLARTPLAGEPQLVLPPTALAIVVLAARNFLLMALGFGVWRALRHKPRPATQP
jgi:hypothetical protein